MTAPNDTSRHILAGRLRGGGLSIIQLIWDAASENSLYIKAIEFTIEHVLDAFRSSCLFSVAAALKLVQFVPSVPARAEETFKIGGRCRRVRTW